MNYRVAYMMELPDQLFERLFNGSCQRYIGKRYFKRVNTQFPAGPAITL
jgi:hypothetical protein